MGRQPHHGLSIYPHWITAHCPFCYPPHLWLKWPQIRLGLMKHCKHLVYLHSPLINLTAFLCPFDA